MQALQQPAPFYAPFVESCAKHGISRKVAYALARNGQLDTFKIGARRYVMLDSLRELPQLLREAA